MGGPLDSHSLTGSDARPRRPLLVAWLVSPVWWGLAACVACYLLMPYLPVQREFFERYLAGHWICYCTTAMFFVGGAVLVAKASRLGRERTALENDFLGSAEPDALPDPAARAARIERALAAQPQTVRETLLAERLRDACADVRGRGSVSGFEDHLKYLAELAAERLHSSYGPVRTVIWAIPILGFLGTVIGITIAIANVTPKQLESSIGEVTAGLAVAFDTTAQALVLSLVLVVASFLVERAEQEILSRIERFGIKRLLPLFPPADGAGEGRTTLLEAEDRAARLLLARTESLVERQLAAWTEGLDGLRSRWNESLQRQQAALDEALRQGMDASLADHAARLADLRDAVLDEVSRATGELARTREESARLQERLVESLADRLEQVERSRAEADRVRAEREAAAGAEQVDRLRDWSREFVSGLEAWQSSLAAQSLSAQDRIAELHRQGETLLRIADHERQLVRVEERLTENLAAVQAAETLEQTLHALNAAVHVLTARTSARAA